MAMSSQQLITQLTSRIYYTTGFIRALEDDVLNDNVGMAQKNLVWAKECIDQHNNQNPTDTVSLKELLDAKYHKPYVENSSFTLLDRAYENKSAGMLKVLRKHGASETSKTSYCPSFWNATSPVTQAINDVVNSDFLAHASS